MSMKDDGGLAFPVASDAIGHYGGMTLRDYFADKAMQAAFDHAMSSGINMNAMVAKAAYEIADRMLAERIK